MAFQSSFCKTRADVVSQRAPWLVHSDLDMIIRKDALKDQALVLDLKDYERALVWIDGRFAKVLGAGRKYALWTKFRESQWKSLARGSAVSA
ncbi:MAG: hypothetical protein R2941_01960 [Desulfobacterales bacterium]